MRSLVALNIFFLSGISVFVHSLYAKEIKLTSTSSTFNQSKTSVATDEKLKNNVQATNVAVNEINVQKNWQVNIELQSNTIDYSNYKIYDYDGNSVTLGHDTQEKNLSLNQIFIKDNHIFDVTIGSNMATSPVKKTLMQFSYIQKIDQTDLFGLSVGLQRQNIPLSYFTNPNNDQRESRPTQLDTYSLTFHYEKIFSEKYKNRAEFSVSQRVQDRPETYGFLFKNLYVLTETAALRADLGYLAENKNQPLKSDLGYQSAVWTEWKLIRPINSFVSYAVGYGVEINREDQAWRGIVNQLADDKILIDFKYEQSNWAADVNLAYVKYNTEQMGLGLSAGVTWIF